jgi:hypothetical protein
VSTTFSFSILLIFKIISFIFTVNSIKLLLGTISETVDVVSLPHTLLITWYQVDVIVRP